MTDGQIPQNDAEIIVGDCRDVMAGMTPGSVDAIVTDPPYDLPGGFMGKDWDRTGVAFQAATWETALRVLKPGGHLLAFGGTRTWHRLAVALEDAGFEIRDTLMWLYGSGFPKHKSLLKPAWEPIILAKKRGKSVLNIDDCRIGSDVIQTNAKSPTDSFGMRYGASGFNGCDASTHTGRWPANLLLDEESAALLDAQSGASQSRPSGYDFRPSVKDNPAHVVTNIRSGVHYDDSGGASRFFYVAKASSRERSAGLEAFPTVVAGAMKARQDGSLDGHIVRGRNHHPTVKPITLMRYLIRLVASPGETVFDPFTGSGSTGCAAVLEGRRFAGAELNPEYAELARARILHWQPDGGSDDNEGTG